MVAYSKTFRDLPTIDRNTLIGKIMQALSKRDTKLILDVLHLLRIEYAEDLFDLSNRTRNLHDRKLEGVFRGPGVYLILIVDPAGNAMLYAGRTSGKSATSGLRFRVRDHVRLLGKTPLTLFIPNWWIKKVYPIPLEDKEQAKILETKLWAFLKEHSKKMTSFETMADLEKELYKIIKNNVPSIHRIDSVELQPGLCLKTPFLLRSPPAGGPRKRAHERD